jgi:hypothetical protein
MNLSINLRTTIQKFIHRRAPTNQREHRFYSYKSPFCRLCPTTEECQNHILQCKECVDRSSLRKNYLLTLKSYLEHTGTNTTTIRVIISYLNSWLQQSTLPDIQTIAPEASKFLEKAIHEQNQLGWDQWFHGRITIQWGEMYNNDIVNGRKIKQGMTAEKWGKEVIGLTWQFVLDCWHLRNSIEHDSLNDPTLRAKEKLAEKILWTINKIPKSISHPYELSTEAELTSLPLDNLTMTLENLSSLITLENDQ